MALDSTGQQRIPELFQEIMRIDDQLAAAFSDETGTIPFETYRLIERKRELMRAAEAALAWNTNKGNTA